MTPSVDESLNTDLVAQEQKPSLTWKLDLSSNRIKGQIDNKDAILQAVEKILLTERYAYRIYSWNYGAELQFYIGKDTDFVTADAERTIKEALLQDDRILDIENFAAKLVDLDSVSVSFTVVSVAGNFDYKKEIATL